MFLRVRNFGPLKELRTNARLALPVTMSQTTTWWCLALVLAGTACVRGGENKTAELSARVDSLADRFLDVQIELFPELATSFGLIGARHYGLTD